MNLLVNAIRLELDDRIRAHGITHPTIRHAVNAYGELVLALLLPAETTAEQLDAFEADVRAVAAHRKIDEPIVKRKVNEWKEHVIALILPREMTPELRDHPPRKHRPA